ncbi:MAG: glycosyltransferase [candidate division FCPU426 bacterium]
MARADLHVHSKYSRHASEWFLKKLGANESYSEPEEVFRLAKANGMRFVTLTDHNRIDGVMRLQAKYPGEVFTGMEATAYFPEDGCKVHVLIYGLDEKDFAEIERRRGSIYELRDYLKARDLAHAVAHATYSVNDRLRREHLEKLLLLFDVFEGINGSRDKMSNLGWMDILRQITPRQTEDLARRHGIEPTSRDPWVKGIIGGSDDHAGLFVGRTYTQAGASTPEEFLQQLKNKLTVPGGRHNNYQGFTFAIYKIAYDFSREKSTGLSRSLVHQLNELLFHSRQMPLADRLRLKAWKNGARQDKIQKALLDLVERIRRDAHRDIEDKLRVVYEQLAELADAFFRTLFESLEKSLRHLDAIELIKDLSSLIPGLFLSAPFFTSVGHMFQGRPLIGELKQSLFPNAPKAPKRILWFTDTHSDLNGVAETIKQTAWLAHQQRLPLQIAAAVDTRQEQSGQLPPIVLALPYIREMKLPYYEKVSLRIPSLLKAIDLIYRADPEEIIVSTPGPVGLVGLLAGRLLNIPCIGVYHTDFSAQIHSLSLDEDLGRFVENYIRWFYQACGQIKVSSQNYLRILRDRGYDASKLVHYRKGLDTGLFSPRPDARQRLKSRLTFPEAPLLLYVGRLSQDKNMDFMLGLYRRLMGQDQRLNLLIVGDGPYKEEMQAKTASWPGVRFLGRQPREELPWTYSAADVLVFPSTTDTFGMVVLEAQACGLPAVVSNQGGPQEIVRHQETGLVVPAGQTAAWEQALLEVLAWRKLQPERYLRMRQRARREVLDRYCPEDVLGGLLGGAFGAGAEPTPTAAAVRSQLERESELAGAAGGRLTHS